MIPLEPGQGHEAPNPLEGRAPTGDVLRIKVVVFLLFLWVMIRNGWLSEDAFITFRVVDNFTHGFGLRWNILDRVQVFTHPLWFFCVSAFYATLRSIYFAAIIPSFLFSGLAVWLLLARGLQTRTQVLLAAVILIFSKAFVDYSSSGLENPLSHLLLVLFFLEYLEPQSPPLQRFRRMVWIAGLLLVNRMDLIWLVLPPLVELAAQHGLWKPRHLRLWAGLSTFIAWELFSLLYYGFPFPNTAYVKLVNGVQPLHLLAQGGYYLVNSLAWDPITLFAIAGLLLLGFHQRRSDRPAAMLCLAVVLQLAYTVRIGGDYMSGRFLSAPLLVCVFLLSRIRFDQAVESAAMGAALLALGAWSPHPPIGIDEDYKGSRTNFQWVDDEHGLRAGDTGFLRLNKNTGLKDINNPWLREALEVRKKHTPVIVFPNIGYFGFFAGPDIHIIDPYAIGDPLLAHLPCDRVILPGGELGECHVANSPYWASGHFVRVVPQGYEAAVLDRGQISDPAIEAYWEKLSLVTRGPLLDGRRLKEILRFNLGLNPPPQVQVTGLAMPEEGELPPPQP